MLIPGIQSFCGALGRWSCYAFCILKIAERITGKHYDVMEEMQYAIKKKWLYYNWGNENDADNLFVQDPQAWLNYLTGMKFTVSKAYDRPGPEVRYVVECWNNAHFRLPDWDSLNYSNSVANGKITSWRVFK